MRNRHNHKEVQKRVQKLLEEKPATRLSYDYLYIEFIRDIDPDAVYKPFCNVMLNLTYPSYQSIARASRFIKRKCPWLKEPEENTMARQEIENGYYFEYCKRDLR